MYQSLIVIKETKLFYKGWLKKSAIENVMVVPLLHQSSTFLFGLPGGLGQEYL